MSAVDARPVIFLIGSTASGKTALACALADRFPLDLVSVDSALVYRGMDIGTAKPDAAMLASYPHQLIDLINPDQSYSAADFRRDAMAAIAATHARGKIPLLVGGTMMYVKALVDGLSALPPADDEIRALIECEAAVQGWPAMHAELARVDPASAARLEPGDTQRVQRALEVFRLTGTPLSALQLRAQSVRSWQFPSLMLGLVPSDRSMLHARIATRFDTMIRAGLVDELRELRQRYALNALMPSMRCVGYRQAWQFMDAKISTAQFHDAAIAATRQLAKRQMTWMRSMSQLEQFDPLDPAIEAQLAQRIAVFLAS